MRSEMLWNNMTAKTKGKKQEVSVSFFNHVEGTVRRQRRATTKKQACEVNGNTDKGCTRRFWSEGPDSAHQPLLVDCCCCFHASLSKMSCLLFAKRDGKNHGDLY